MAFIFAGIVVCFLFHRTEFFQCLLAIFLFTGLYFIAPADTPDFPWRVVFFFALGGVILIIHFLTKPKSMIDKTLSPSEQAYQEWCDSKADPDIRDFYKR